MIKEYHTKTGKRIRLIHGDCMDWMKDCDPYDLAIIDPPYGLGSRIFDGGKRGDMESLGRLSDGKVERWDSKPEKPFFDALKKCSTNQIIWGGNYFLDYLGSNDGLIVWDKMNGTNALADAEIAWKSLSGTTRMFRMHHFSLGYDSKIHPTQKPVKLYRWLLQNYAKDGDRILDTHGGSMSHAIACYDEDFELDIIELDKDYYDSAVKRFEQHISQKTLF